MLLSNSASINDVVLQLMEYDRVRAQMVYSENMKSNELCLRTFVLKYEHNLC